MDRQKLDWDLVHKHYNTIQQGIRDNDTQMGDINSLIAKNIGSIMQICTVIVARGSRLGSATGIEINDEGTEATLYAAFIVGMCPYIGQGIDNIYDAIKYMTENYIDPDQSGKIAETPSFENDMRESGRLLTYHFNEVMADFAKICDKINNHPVLIKIVESYAAGNMLGLAIRKCRDEGGFKAGGPFDALYQYCMTLSDSINRRDEK